MPVAHWIKPNEAVNVPNRWVFLDTEAHRAEAGPGVERQTWRLAVTCYDHRRSRNAPWAPAQVERHETPESLWAYIDGRVRKHGRTIVVAHNMGYDLRISRGLTELPRLGWTMTRWQVNDRGCVIHWRHGERSLWLVDSMNWLPMSLERVGGMIGGIKPPLPGENDGEGKWWQRCESDVAILRAAWMSLLDWVATDELGNWQPTAGAMAWAEWRHRHYTDRVLVHDDDRAREAERDASYTGRCEALRHGQLSGGRWYEYDLPLAYARVALDTPVPVVLAAHWRKPRLASVLADHDSTTYLVRADIDQPMPVLAERSATGIRWPVGAFTGWYWACELRLAARHGAAIRPIEAYRYVTQPALTDWATWIIDYVEGPEGERFPLRRAAAKVWARALIGRFASRYCKWEDAGAALDEGVTIDHLVDLETGQSGRFLQVADKAYTGLEMADGAETAPAVMSLVMAEARCRLWEAMQVAGPDNVAYVDTDSVLVAAAGKAALDAAIAAGQLWGMRAKSQHAAVTVHGPRQLTIGGAPRMAGLPRQAERIGADVWAGDAWSTLEGSIRTGETDQVTVTRRLFTAGQVDNRRRHLPGGRTEPYRAGEDQAAASG